MFVRRPTRRPTLRPLVLLLLALGFVRPDAARAVGTITGTVTTSEPSGSVVAGAFVAATGPAGQVGTVTDDTGAYTLDVEDGTYTVVVGAPGNQVGRAAGVTVSGDEVVRSFLLTASGTKFSALGVFGGQISGILADGQTGVFYAATSVIPQLFRTVDYGGTWSPVTLASDDADDGLNGDNTSGGSGMATSGFPGEVAAIVQSTLYYSTDFGVTWKAALGVLGGGPNPPALYWGHVGSTSVLLAVGGATTLRADMTAPTPTLAAMTTPYAGANDRMAVANGADAPWVAVVDAAGQLSIYPLDMTATPVAASTLAGFPANPTFVRFGGGHGGAGNPPDAVLVYASGNPSGTAVLATKSAASASFSAGDLSSATAIGGGCGAGPGAVGSLSPLSTGTDGSGTVSQCFLTKTGTSMTAQSVSGINNNTGLVFDAGYDGASNQVIISGDGNHGLVKSAQAMSGVPSFPNVQFAQAGTGAGTGGIAVNGFTVGVVKDSTYGPAGASQVATILSGSGGGFSIASDDGGATMVPAVVKGGRAVDWFTGAGKTWLVFGYGGAGSLLAARQDWVSANPALPGPNVANSDAAALSSSPGNFDVTALAGIPGSDSLFIGGGLDVDQAGTTGSVVRADLTAGPALSNVTPIAASDIAATVRALAYCPTTGSASSVQDVLLIATGTSGQTLGGGLVRVTAASTGSPASSVVATVPTNAPTNDVRVHCASGTVYAGAGSNGGGPSGSFYKSTDGGATFSTVAVTAPGLPPSLNVEVVAVSPDDPNTVYIAGNREGFIVQSSDGGTSWTVANDPHAPGGRNFLSEGVGDIEIPPAAVPLHTGGVAADVSAPTSLVGTGGGLFAADFAAAPVGPGCTQPTDCDDADPCTDDACDGGSCTHTTQTGEPGVLCSLDQLPDACGADPIDAKLTKVLNKKIAKLRKLVQKAGTSAKKKAKLLKSVDKGLAGLRATVAKAGTKGRISGGCTTGLQSEIDAIRALLASV